MTERQRQRSPSPPSYQVYETKDGRLVNRLLRVEWPNHPPANKQLFDGYILAESKQFPSTAPTFFPKDSSRGTSSLTNKFLGPATLQSVNEKLAINDFVIFYPLSDEYLPAKLPLLLAYRSSQDKVYYLPIKREKHRWVLKFPDGNENLSFQTMENLIEHFFIYGFLNTKSKEVDIFRSKLLESLKSSDTKDKIELLI